MGWKRHVARIEMRLNAKNWSESHKGEDILVEVALVDRRIILKLFFVLKLCRRVGRIEISLCLIEPLCEILVC
jgi:hypothetical protein